MEIIPILNAMMRNKVGAILIGLQIAITLAIVTNAMFIIEERSVSMSRPTGIDEDNTFYLSISGVGDDYNGEDELNADLVMLRSMSGIINVSTVNSLPLTNSGSSNSYSIEASDNPDVSIRSTTYRYDEHFINAMGLNLVEGENFKASDVNYLRSDEVTTYNKVIVTKAFAEAAYGKDQGPYVGRTIYPGDQRALTIIGVVERLQVPWASGAWTKGWAENALIVPLKLKSNFQRFIVRAEAGKLNQMIPLVVEALRARNPNRIIRDPQPYSEIRYNSYRGDIAMSRILTTTVIILFIITSLGIVGLASFTVNRRKKQIGTRRALGARKIDIIRYFMTENFLITIMGLSLGALLTYLLNYWLVETYSMTKISWYYVPLGMIVLSVLGQLAVFMPARKAASISPAMATRSV
ncbi:MAG: putative ABC transport system permease protein [Enterobacterales bacterium]|jgi:putative ABC transport system permease protein